MTVPRVLVVDDDEATRYVLARLLYGCEIAGEAADGRAAVDAAERLHPDLVLLDVSMPGLNGFDAARLMRERWPEVRIIFVSMHAERAYAEKGFELGARGYVVKRAAAAELAAAVSAVLAGQCYESPLLVA